MASKDDYLQLSERLNNLKERRAILVSDEERKKEERKTLISELSEAGIDSSKPQEEIDRLEREIQDEYTQSKALVDQFEENLMVATGEKRVDLAEVPLSSEHSLDLE